MAGSRRARLTRSTGVAVLGTLLMGCYVTRPIGGVTPPTGVTVAFDLNDAGRAALGPMMGPEIARIEGRILNQDAGDYVVAVDELTMLRGGTQTWRGEQVRVKPGYIAATYEKRFSKSRTVLLAALAAGGVAYLVSRSVVGSGESEQKNPGDTLATYRGVVRP